MERFESPEAQAMAKIISIYEHFCEHFRSDGPSGDNDRGEIEEYEWELPHISATCRGWFVSHNFAASQPGRHSSLGAHGSNIYASITGSGVFTFQHS